MKSLLLSNKTEQTSSSSNLQSISKAKRHFQKLSYKTLITSSEIDKNKNKHKYLNTDNLGVTVKKINFQDSTQLTTVCHTNENLNNNKSQPTKIFPKYHLINENSNYNFKKNEEKKKIKQSSIDLQNNRYTNIVNKNYYKSAIKDKNINLNTRKNINDKKQPEKILKRSIIEKDKIKNIRVTKPKEKNIKKSFTPSTIRTTEESEKIRDESKNKESIILSSISTFKSLFNVKEKKERKIISQNQKYELEELKNKLKSIPINNKEKNENIKNLKEKKYNIISADMLEETIKNENEINKEIIISSEQRIQTYTLLLECISKKFKEIEDLLEENEEKVSELHSKIEFTNNEENIDSMTTIINYDERINNNSCDCEDSEIQEKSNIIVPKGENVKKINNKNNINKERILTDTCVNRVNSNTIFFDMNSFSMNSEILKKTINDNNDFVSFLSNDMISFFQPNNNLKMSDINELKDKIPKKEKKDKNEENNNKNNNNNNNCYIF